jgi:CRP-like cAMP-binding protein
VNARPLFDQLPVLAWLPEPAKDRLASRAELRRYEAGDVLLRQHDEARTVAFVLTGAVSMLLTFDGVDRLLVDQDARPGQVLGWSAFRPPYRYTATVRAETCCSVLVVPRSDFLEVFAQDRRLEYHWLRQIAGEVGDRMARTAAALAAPPAVTDDGS